MDTFEVVADPARRRILDLLLIAPRAVGELVDETRLSQPNTSRHLRVLREAGFVESHAAGQRRVYALRGDGFAELARWLTPYVLLWQGSWEAAQDAATLFDRDFGGPYRGGPDVEPDAGAVHS